MTYVALYLYMVPIILGISEYSELEDTAEELLRDHVKGSEQYRQTLINITATLILLFWPIVMLLDALANFVEKD